VHSNKLCNAANTDTGAFSSLQTDFESLRIKLKVLDGDVSEDDIEERLLAKDDLADAKKTWQKVSTSISGLLYRSNTTLTKTSLASLLLIIRFNRSPKNFNCTGSYSTFKIILLLRRIKSWNARLVVLMSDSSNKRYCVLFDSRYYQLMKL